MESQTFISFLIDPLLFFNGGFIGQLSCIILDFFGIVVVSYAVIFAFFLGNSMVL